jgi:hypothetical protein
VKLRVHTELRSSIFGRMAVTNRADYPDLRWSTFDVKKFLRLIDVEEVNLENILEFLQMYM